MTVRTDCQVKNYRAGREPLPSCSGVGGWGMVVGGLVQWRGVVAGWLNVVARELADLGPLLIFCCGGVWKPETAAAGWRRQHRRLTDTRLTVDNSGTGRHCFYFDSFLSGSSHGCALPPAIFCVP